MIKLFKYANDENSDKNATLYVVPYVFPVL